MDQERREKEKFARQKEADRLAKENEKAERKRMEEEEKLAKQVALEAAKREKEALAQQVSAVKQVKGPPQGIKSITSFFSLGSTQ